MFFSAMYNKCSMFKRLKCVASDHGIAEKKMCSNSTKKVHFLLSKRPPVSITHSILYLTAPPKMKRPSNFEESISVSRNQSWLQIFDRGISCYFTSKLHVAAILKFSQSSEKNNWFREIHVTFEHYKVAIFWVTVAFISWYTCRIFNTLWQVL